MPEGSRFYLRLLNLSQSHSPCPTGTPCVTEHIMESAVSSSMNHELPLWLVKCRDVPHKIAPERVGGNMGIVLFVGGSCFAISVVNQRLQKSNLLEC